VLKSLVSTLMPPCIHYGMISRHICWNCNRGVHALESLSWGTFSICWDMNLSRWRGSMYMCGRMRGRKSKTIWKN